MTHGSYPEVTLVRHAETAWSASAIHTGHVDTSVTQAGERSCSALGHHLHSQGFAAIWSSPSQRAMHTCVMCGFDTKGIILRDDLREWDYGRYEGLTTSQINMQRPGWNLFRDGCPEGESVKDVGNRADAVIVDLRKATNVAVFSSRDFLRVLAARWIGLEPEQGALFVLDTASASVLGYEHTLNEPVIQKWNEKFPAV
ncbi:putative phosphoglycerate mutase [Rhizobium sp. PP-WC-2G-219]|nr:putative phosphoglycerate mutase [Rhizobium sp. PP-WC-2G-219]